jgi:GDSL-like Lipase/Acylhydrolase family
VTAASEPTGPTPQVIDRDLGTLIELTNISCGAAVIEDITFNSQNPIGRHLPPFSEDQDYPFPPVPAQSEAVYSGTDVVTVGVGGNTLGFAAILFTCLQLGEGSEGAGTPCRDELAGEMPGRLDKVRRDYVDMLTALHQRAPEAKIVTVGYPTVIPADTAKCRHGDWEQFATITPGDLEWLRADVLEPLNAVIEETSGEHASTFVDLQSPSRNHSVCDGNKWVEGVFASFPTEVALVHPNAMGHRSAASVVAAAILGALDLS